MNRPIRLLLADVDGTLVNSQKALTQDAIQAAHALKAAGIRLAVTSGRPPRGMRMLVQPLVLDGLLAGFNGGLYTRPDLTPVTEHRLPPELARDSLALIADHGLQAWVYSGDDWLVCDPEAPHVAHEAHTVQFQPRIVSSFTDLHLRDAIKIVGVSDDHARVETAEEAAQTSLGSRASATRSQPYYLDITHPDANKGAVVRTLSREWNIPMDQIATIGDSPNDVLMFRESGFSIAMGNASDTVKKQASATTRGNDDNGFAHAVRTLILGGLA